MAFFSSCTKHDVVDEVNEDQALANELKIFREKFIQLNNVELIQTEEVEMMIFSNQQVIDYFDGVNSIMISYGKIGKENPYRIEERANSRILTKWTHHVYSDGIECMSVVSYSPPGYNIYCW